MKTYKTNSGIIVGKEASPNLKMAFPTGAKPSFLYYYRVFQYNANTALNSLFNRIIWRFSRCVKYTILIHKCILTDEQSGIIVGSRDLFKELGLAYSIAYDLSNSKSRSSFDFLSLTLDEIQQLESAKQRFFERTAHV